MKQVRKPAVAGAFYPADARELALLVREQLAAAGNCENEPVPRALIAPHAGFVYSGPVAGSAYARLARGRRHLHRVVLLGPSHRVPLLGLGVSSADAFETPLGLVPVDRDAVERLVALPQVAVRDDAHRLEHSLEVHLPFLQEVLGAFRLVPLVVGEATPEQVAEVIEALWDDPGTVVVVSTDLSHYYDYATARRMDRATSEAIQLLRPDAIGVEDACGRYPVRGLLLAARRRGLACRTVDLRSSGDTAGPREQVVGYGSYVLS